MTLKELRKEYTRLRTRYYAGAELPRASEIRFRWAEAGERSERIDCKCELARVAWDETEPVSGKYHYQIVLNPELKGYYSFIILVLLHEMSHLHNKKAEHGPWFKQEANRLGALGALAEVFY